MNDVCFYLTQKGMCFCWALNEIINFFTISALSALGQRAFSIKRGVCNKILCSIF